MAPEVAVPTHISMDRKELLEAYTKCRNLSEELCSPLTIEDHVVQPIEDVSPPKWHLGHTTWFFEQVILHQFKQGYEPFHPKYYYLFNSYYQSFGERWDRPQRGTLSRPTVEEVWKYRRYIDEQMTEYVSNLADEEWEKIRYLTVLGINHEQQHQELLLTDIKFIMATSPLNPVYVEREFETGEKPTTDFVEFKAGVYEIGAESNGFAYDNEFPRHKTYVQDFRLMDRLVTCGEFLEFMEDGGYKAPTLWLSDGWAWIDETGANKPLYWHREEGDWHIMTLSGLKKLKLNEPVCHVNHYEAMAYARWKGLRLPTEAEWEAAVQKSGIGPDNGNFVDERKFHPTVVSTDGNGKPRQMFGDVWEWTNSAYLPYPGYKQAEGALGEYNGKFMSNQMVLRGGSCATSRSHIRTTYRNFFQPEKQWQLTGFRLASDQ